MDRKDEFNFADFFAKNKRYLSAAILVAALVIVLICCLARGGNDSGKNTGETETNAPSPVVMTDIKLEKDAVPELVDLMHNYYTASANASIEDLEMLAEPLGENEKSYIRTFSEFYEEYKNITCYSTPGQTKDSYLVSVCYDLKFKDIDTPAPGMDFFYVERNGKGNLYINNIYSSYNFNFMEEPLDSNLYAMILDYEKSEEVTSLQQDVQTRYDQAIVSDENLANMVGGKLRDAMNTWRKSITGSETQTEKPQTQTESQAQTETQTQTETETQTETQTQETPKEDKKPKKKKTSKVKTKDICRVRKGPSTDDEILGTVDKGVVLTKLGTKGDWTKVKFQGGTGYIKTEFLKAVKSSAKSDSKKDSAKVRTKDICRVRKGPSTDDEVLGTVDVGVELEKLGTEGDWAKVKFQGKTGYIKTEFLKNI